MNLPEIDVKLQNKIKPLVHFELHQCEYPTDDR